MTLVDFDSEEQAATAKSAAMEREGSSLAHRTPQTSLVHLGALCAAL